MYFDQREFDIKCEWGARGIAALAPHSDAIVIVDVFSFCTCVDIAIARGAIVYPYRSRDDSAAAYAASLSAELASPYRKVTTGYSLSPASLLNIPAGTRLVLPSPNGSALTLATGNVPTFAGCLRNARAVAAAAQKLGRRIAVIPAGERWPGDTLRPALEDMVGTGAIVHYLPGSRSPEAALAEAAFSAFRADLLPRLQACASGKELLEHGFQEDVVLAAAFDVSDSAPVLVEGAYRQRPDE